MEEHREILRILRAQSGDIKALDELLRSVERPLFRLVHRIVCHQEVAEDVLQDVFILICRNLTFLRDPEHFLSWAYRIAARQATRRARRESRTPVGLDDRALAQLPDPDVPDPLREVMKDRLPALVNQIPPAGRAVLALHYLDDLTLPEVADVLEIPLGTVKSRLSYGLGLLRQMLGSGESSGTEPSTSGNTHEAS